jgi:hypothetical protein
VIDRCEHMECGICEVCALERASGPAAEVAGLDFDAAHTACMLCGKAASEVRHMVAGAFSERGAVCDECVGQALILLASKGWVPPTIRIGVSVDLAEIGRLKEAVDKLLSVVNRDAHAIEGVTEAYEIAWAFVNSKGP